MPTNEWGDSSGWGQAQAPATQFNMNPAVTGWGDYLRGQESQYQMKRPEVADITQGPYKQKMATVMGEFGAGQRNATDEYVKRAGLAGVQRGGFAPSSNINPQAALQQDAIKNLASGYGQNYGNALNYMQQLAAAQQAQYGQAQGQLANLWGLQSTGLGQGLQDIQGQRGYDVNLRQLQDAATQRGWQGGQNTLQRQSTEGMQSKDIAAQMERLQLNLGNSEADRAAQLERQLSQQGWQTGENTSQRGWQTGERTGTQEWQGGQNTQQQSWQGGQNTLQRQSTEGMQSKDIAAQMERLQANLGNSEAERQAQMERQQSQQGWQGSQNTQAQQAEAARQQAQFGQTQQTQGWQTGENTSQRGWQGTQNTAANKTAIMQSVLGLRGANGASLAAWGNNPAYINATSMANSWGR